MKKKTTTAILLATTMMLALMGCGAASTDVDSSTDATSIEEVTANSESNSSEATSDTGSDSASADSSDTSDTSTASYNATFTYKGETFSFLDDLQTTLDKIDPLGKPCADSPIERDDGSKVYSYDETEHDSDFFINTFIDNGKLSVGQISLMGPNAKTSKGIGIGSTVEEIISAYGKPGNAEAIYDYTYDNYILSFDVRDNKVFSINYISPTIMNR